MNAPGNGVRLSHAYATTQRHQPGDLRPRYSQLGPGREICDECAAVRHEEYNIGWPTSGLRQATTRRDGGAPTPLLLCDGHTRAWQERDSDDGVPPPAAVRRRR